MFGKRKPKNKFNRHHNLWFYNSKRLRFITVIPGYKCNTETKLNRLHNPLSIIPNDFALPLSF
ncbi:hypothetical protein Avbf_17051 [Armadillidium vulgare]|nr:hypothetical protein Avbf_17051 [Armadillidium vulgare]